MDEFYNSIKSLPAKFLQKLANIPKETANKTTEIRIRIGCPIILTLIEGFSYVYYDAKPVVTDKSDVEMCVLALCSYSIYSVEECINNGYIPLENGNRAGVCGKATVANEKIKVWDISSINIRIARNFIQKIDDRLVQILNNPFLGLVIAGPPASGKTTILKSVIKQLSLLQKRTAIVDERCELSCIAPCEHCDFLYAYPKVQGMLQALRSLSPQIIVCDELGAMEDIKAIEQTANSGVGLVVSIHSQNIESLYTRPQSKAILNTGAFNAICVLKGSEYPGEIERIILNDDIC